VDPELIQSIHKWTEGLPHLVTLAASWLKSATPQETAAGISGVAREQGVQEFLLDAISELLDSVDRAILDAASVFRDRFSDDALAFAAELTAGEVEDASRRLVRRHLATRSRDGDVAFFHASVREYFYARLAEGRRQAVHARAAEWYAQQANRLEAAYHRERAS
jgi:predicted ATPase